MKIDTDLIDRTLNDMGQMYRLDRRRRHEEAAAWLCVILVVGIGVCLVVF